MTSPRPANPQCPLDGAPLQRWPDGIIDCPHCNEEYVIALSPARPAWAINKRAPFARLVIEADQLLHGRKTVAA